MSLQSATTVLASMYRGSHYTLKVQILDENGDAEDLTGIVSVVARLAHSYTDTNSVLQITGSVLVAATGLVEFVFVPANTSGLAAKAYDLTVILTDAASKVRPALQGRFGIEAINPATA